MISSEVKSKIIVSDWPSLVHLADKEAGWIMAPTRYKNFLNTNIICLPVPVSIIPPTEFYILYRKENFDRKWLLPTLEKIKDTFN
jgi:hypothetical protein